MKLHEHKEEFEELIAIVANHIGIPADAVRRDYYIVMLLKNLQDSEYADMCVFDVTVLFDRPDIQEFLFDTSRLKELLQLTKETDSFYLQKRNISREYNPVGPYAFESWQMHFNDEIRSRYESLHEDLLYTSERQHFEDAVQAFTKISQLFNEIGE